jgi:hypothetical protein
MKAIVTAALGALLLAAIPVEANAVVCGKGVYRAGCAGRMEPSPPPARLPCDQSLHGASIAPACASADNGLAALSES